MHTKVVLDNSADVARKLCREIVAGIDPGLFSSAEIFGIQLAIEEAMVNAVEHGNGGDPAKHVTVEYSIDPGLFEIAITDEGPGFKLQDVPDPCSDEGLSRASGRGIALMRAYMDRVEYNDAGNCVRMVKHAPGTAAGNQG
jgi:serine/threonine-protein kinase RsbW